MFMGSYFGGLFMLILGVFQTYKSWKSDGKIDGSILQPYLSGWIAGVGSILLGITIIVLKILGKH